MKPIRALPLVMTAVLKLGCASNIPLDGPTPLSLCSGSGCPPASGDTKIVLKIEEVAGGPKALGLSFTLSDGQRSLQLPNWQCGPLSLPHIAVIVLADDVVTSVNIHVASVDGQLAGDTLVMSKTRETVNADLVMGAVGPANGGGSCSPSFDAGTYNPDMVPRYNADMAPHQPGSASGPIDGGVIPAFDGG